MTENSTQPGRPLTVTPENRRTTTNRLITQSQLPLLPPHQEWRLSKKHKQWYIYDMEKGHTRWGYEVFPEMKGCEATQLPISANDNTDPQGAPPLLRSTEPTKETPMVAEYQIEEALTSVDPAPSLTTNDMTTKQEMTSDVPPPKRVKREPPDAPVTQQLKKRKPRVVKKRTLSVIKVEPQESREHEDTHDEPLHLDAEQEQLRPDEPECAAQKATFPYRPGQLKQMPRRVSPPFRSGHGTDDVDFALQLQEYRMKRDLSQQQIDNENTDERTIGCSETSGYLTDSEEMVHRRSGHVVKVFIVFDTDVLFLHGHLLSIIQNYLPNVTVVIPRTVYETLKRLSNGNSNEATSLLRQIATDPTNRPATDPTNRPIVQSFIEDKFQVAYGSAPTMVEQNRVLQCALALRMKLRLVAAAAHVDQHDLVYRLSDNRALLDEAMRIGDEVKTLSSEQFTKVLKEASSMSTLQQE